MNKQIEKMAKIIDQAQKQGYQRIFEETRKFVQENHRYSSKNDYDKAHSQTIDEIIAEALYNAGYRKVNDEELKKFYSLEEADYWKSRVQEIGDVASEETAREILGVRQYIRVLFHKYHKQRDEAESEYRKSKEENFKFKLNNDWHRCDAIMFILEKVGDYMDNIAEKYNVEVE